MESLNILGASGHAKVILALARAQHYTAVQVYDDDEHHPATLLDAPVTHPLSVLPDDESQLAFIAIGSNEARQRVAARFRQVRWATLIHPTAWVAPDVTIGQGSVVMGGVVIQPGAHIGKHVIINTCASVDHDCRLDDFVHVAPGGRLAGNVHLAEGVFAGVNCAFVPGTRVGRWSVVGAGATVVHPLGDFVTAVGTPARTIKHRSDSI